MESIDADRRIPLLNIAEGDLYVLLGFPVAGLLLGTLSGIDLLVLPLVCLGITCGVAVVYAAPAHVAAGTWLQDVARFYLRRPRVTRNRHAADDESTVGADVSETLEPFTVDETTQELTGIERAWPGYAAVQRQDGAMEAFLEISPGNMDFAMSDDWAARQAIGEAFANQELAFRLTLHTTTDPYPADELVAQLDDRLAEPAVTANEPLRTLIAEYRDRRPDDLADTNRIRYFLGVEVSPFEVYERRQMEPTPAERLTTIPVVGVLFNPFVTRREQLTEAELRGAQLEKLADRIRTVDTEFVAKTSDWSARRLSTAELVGLAVQFWNGEGADEPSVPRRAAVSHEPREDHDA